MEENKPSFSEKAVNLANFSWDLIRYIVQNGLDKVTVTDEVFNQRMEICKGCDRFHVEEEEDEEDEYDCLECGCNVILKAKVALDSCPLGKWTPDKTDWDKRFDSIMEEMDQS